MAQQPAALTPLVSTRHFFGAQLRYWRKRRGLSLAQLGRAVYVSADLVGKAEKAQRWPSPALVRACETVLDSGGALPRAYALAAAERPALGRPRGNDSTQTNFRRPLDRPMASGGILSRSGSTIEQSEVTLAEIHLLPPGAIQPVVDYSATAKRGSSPSMETRAPDQIWLGISDTSRHWTPGAPS